MNIYQRIDFKFIAESLKQINYHSRATNVYFKGKFTVIQSQQIFQQKFNQI